MRIALIQQSCTNDLRANLEKGLAALESAAAQGARIICFPELAFTPFYPQHPATPQTLALAETIPGPTTELFAARAKALGVVIILNLFERHGDHTYDASPIIDADGTILGVTRMVHITDYPKFHEKGYYTPAPSNVSREERVGNPGMPVYNTAYGRIGIAICYDRHYPECMRSLALNHAQIVIVPQAGATGEWPDGLYEAEMQTAAFQNGYFLALCNRVGHESALTFAGQSFICNPHGQIIAQAPPNTEEILLADLDLNQIESSPARTLFLRDRRPELYTPWLT